MNSQFTIDFFIDKFSAILENKWCKEEIDIGNGIHCALGHCGGYAEESSESHALSNILVKYYHINNIPLPKNCSINEIVYRINDGIGPFDEMEETPKKRILAALYEIKKAETPSYPNLSKELAKDAMNVGDAVDVKIKELQS